jgi:hypothetical protein
MCASVCARAAAKSGYAAEALLRAGDWRAAHDSSTKRSRSSTRWASASTWTQLLPIEAAIAKARAMWRLRTIRCACGTEARMQEAPWLELMALRELCAHDAATDDERCALTALTAHFRQATGSDAAQSKQVGPS